MNLQVAGLRSFARLGRLLVFEKALSENLALCLGIVALLFLGWMLRKPYLENVCHSDLRYYVGWSYRSTNYGLGSVYGSRRTELLDGKEIVLLRADNPVGHLAIFHLLGTAFPWLTGQALSLEEVSSINDPPHTAAKLLGRKLFKLPAALVDLLITVLLTLAVSRRYGTPHGLLVGFLYAGHPAILQNSAVWGQVDAWHSLLMLIAVAFWSKGRWVPGSLALGLALLFKLQAIALLPLSAICLLYGRQAGEMTSKPQWGRLVATGLGAVLLALALWTPWILTGAGWHILDPYIRAVGQYHYATVHAFNLWWWANDWSSANPYDFTTGIDDRLPLVIIPGIGLPITYRLVGILLFGLVSARLCQVAIRRNLTPEAIGSATVANCLAFFFLATEMHERYLYPALPLAFFCYRPQGRWWLLAIVLSLAVTLNQGIYHPPPPGTWLDMLTSWARPHVTLVGSLVAGGLLLALLPLLLGPRTANQVVSRTNLVDPAVGSNRLKMQKLRA